VRADASFPATGTDIDSAVVGRIRGGDQEAFREIVDHFSHRIHATAWRITGNAEDAGDVTQDAFVRLHTALCNGTLTENIAAWLNRVTVNVAIDRWRNTTRYHHISLDQAQEHPAGSEARPDITTERRETLGIIRTLAAELSEKQAATFVLRDIEGASVVEIGDFLGCSESTVRVHLSRARLALRTMLKKRYPYLIATGSDQL
jgi:RNA polymerase sigma-70 factor, ECF subfamily